ncbi:MAG: hypothetical protein VX733_01885 [Candidatus Latescibacterota bacterium]|nr:hypothetical protein [Candidatus Latescibacterota bacterium]
MPSYASARKVPYPQQRVVPILGMHRSGTSTFTRALNLMGLELGEPLMTSQSENPKGFWENKFLWDVNVLLLHGVGRHVSGYGTLDQLLEIPGLSRRIERSEEILSTLSQYFRATYFGPTWGWKDPRSVLLFPFWMMVMTELGYRHVSPMIITRPPVASVSSLARRDDLNPLAKALGVGARDLALQMWTAYSRILLDIAEETDCYVGVNEWFFDAELARHELARAAAYCGLSPDADQRVAALDWIAPCSRHHRDTDADAGKDLFGEAEELYEALCSRARSQRAIWLDASTILPTTTPQVQLTPS